MRCRVRVDTRAKSVRCLSQRADGGEQVGDDASTGTGDPACNREDAVKDLEWLEEGGQAEECEKVDEGTETLLTRAPETWVNAR